MEETFAKYINVNGELMDLSHPQVMGILNVTPDSFYADSRKQAEEDIINRVHQIIEEGGRIIDIGAYSSRPDAEDVSPEEEMQRLKHGLQVIRREFHKTCKRIRITSIRLKKSSFILLKKSRNSGQQA